MTTTTAQDRSLNLGRVPSLFTPIDWIAMILMIVGGLNWGLVGLFGFDLVAAIFGPMSVMSRVVYILVGIAALYGIYLLTRMRRSP